jgi:chemotaxis signal transduction protein
VTLAKSKNKNEAKENLVLFTLQGGRYTVENASVVQILHSLSITPVANATSYLLGSTVFQGEVLPVIDLRLFFYGNNMGKEEISEDSNPFYVVLAHLGKSVVFLVESIVGIITRSNELLPTDAFNFTDSSELEYYKSVFIWEKQITVQINIESIFERIKTELHHDQSQSLAEIQFQLPSIENPEILKEFNIDLQHKSVSQPTIGWGINRLIKTAEKEKYTGTIITVDELSILVPNDKLLQIFTISELTNIPNSSETVMGVVNYHGEIINALNLSKCLSEGQDTIKTTEFDQEMKKRALVLSNNNEKLALFVDSIPRIIEVDEREIRRTLILNEKETEDYLFDGAIVDESGQILLILNVNYLFKRYFSIDKVDKFIPHVITFNNPTDLSFRKVSESSQEGLIFEDDGYLYFVDTEFVRQVMVQKSFLYKDYDHEGILGATTYWDTIPLLDFNILLRGKSEKKKKKSIGILLHDPKSGIEATFLVNNIIGRVSIDKFEAFQPETSFYTKMLSRMISGFFSFQDSLGIIVNPTYLLEEAFLIIKNELKLEDVKNEFVSTLKEKERETLEEMINEQREREPLLFSHPTGNLLDFFVFQWGDSMFAIDISLVQRVVISSLEIRKVEPKFNPIIGSTKIENIEQGILDLNSAVMNEDHRVNSNTDCYFSLLYKENSFLVPVDNLLGVITTFQEDLILCEESSKFLEGSGCCQHKFSHDKISSPMYIIETDFLIELLTQNKIKTYLKEINVQKTDLEE